MIEKEYGNLVVANMVRTIRRGRILLKAGLAVGAALALGLIVLLGRTISGNIVWVPVILIAAGGAFGLEYAYIRLTIRNETRFIPLLTEDLRPELYSDVYRQTQEGHKDLPELRQSLAITDAFYTGDDAKSVSLIRNSGRFWVPEHPEFVSYAVQAASRTGDTDTMQTGLAMLDQTVQSSRYAASPMFAKQTDIFRNLALAAVSLAENRPSDAETHARAVLDDGSAIELQTLYADVYLALALEKLGRSDEAAPYREKALSYSSGFGILQALQDGSNLPS